MLNSKALGRGVSSAAVALALLMPSALGAQAAQVPAQPSPGSPPQVDPSPAQTANVPNSGATGRSDAAAAAPVDAAEPEQIVVTGFRRSLDAALNVKRESVSSVDAIVAEDIAKFPDQNLAESLQRIPGISIQRDGGEGRSITVRGLGSQFTRVRVNGLETIATSNDGAAANRERGFDFNVFASELFNSIVVHKTAEASLDEGSLGAVVDLNTGNPLGGKTGLTFAASGQANYNDLSHTWGPRLAGLISWKSPSGDFGVAISAAYSKLKTQEIGNNTVRWAQARFDSVNGTPCFYTTATSTTPSPNTGGVYRPSAGCDAAALAFHPRIPRYGQTDFNRERIGVTGSVQWSPSDATKVSIDGLYSRFRQIREERTAEVLLRSNERTIDIANYAIDANNNLISATLNDAWVRTEHFYRRSTTEFYQLGASWDQDVTDRLRFSALGGFSRSNATVPVETTFIIDDRDAVGYRYDYTNMHSPTLTFGTTVTDPAGFQLAEIRDVPQFVRNTFRTGQLRAEWDVIPDAITVKAGGVYRRFRFDTEIQTRSAVVCPTRTTAAPDAVLGTTTCSPSTLFGSTAVYGLPLTSSLVDLFTLRNAGQTPGTTTQWIVPNIAAAAKYTGLYSRPTTLDLTSARGVTEAVKGGYLQIDAKGSLAGLDYALNAGVRYVKTDQSSNGYNNGVDVTVKRTYDDWLPAVNLAIFPHKNVILRAAVSDVITRPPLSNLTPGGSVDGFNYRVSFGNPQLAPFRATAYDLAVEWYFAPQSVFSIAGFKKKISSFPIAQTVVGTYASTGLPLSLINQNSPAASNPEGQLWTISTNVNGSGANLKGVEIAVQAPFTFLPGFLRHFGGIVNATFVDSDAAYNVGLPVTQANVLPGNTLGPSVGVVRTGTLFGLSKRAYNGTIYYEDSRFSARASISYRSPFLDNASATGNVFEGYGSTINVDASVRYKLSDQLEISLEGINLTDAYRERFVDEAARRNYEYNHFGRTLLIGARFKR